MGYTPVERKVNIKSFSDFFRRRLKPGEENQFFSKKNGIIIDTSFIVGFFYECKLWTLNALLETYLLQPYFLLILPSVANELRGLEIGNRPDKYGNPLVSRNILNDLQARDMRLKIELPENLDIKIVNMWKSVARKYRGYLEEKSNNPDEDIKEPVISPTDIEVIKYALARADKELNSYVVSGDSDITDTVQGFSHRIPIVPIGPYSRPHPEVLGALLEKVVLIGEEALGDARKATSGNYVTFAHLNDENGLGVDIGFRVTDKSVKTEDIYSIPIIDGEDIETEYTENLLKMHRYILVREENRLPALVRSSNFIVSRGKLIDPAGEYKELTIGEYLETRNFDRRDKKTWNVAHQVIQKQRILPLIRSVAYASVEDWYLQMHTPQLFNALWALRASI